MEFWFELREPELSTRQAGLSIKQALRDERIRVTPHAREEMIHDSFDDQDLEAAIRLGAVLDEPELVRTKIGVVVRYRLIGPVIDDSARKMAIVFEVPNEGPVPIITVFQVRRLTRR